MGGEDLHLISGDRDYASLLDEDKINPFLADEWTKQQDSVVILYRSLSQFFKANFPSIHIVSDAATEQAVEDLALSGSFARTHLAIAELEKIEAFTPQQVETLIKIAETNQQVRWIIDDPDVRAFYERLQKNYSNVVGKQYADQLNALLLGELPF